MRMHGTENGASGSRPAGSRAPDARASEPSRSGGAPTASDLVRLIETDLIPRMLLAHQNASDQALARLEAFKERTLPGFDVELVATLALESDGDALTEQVLALLDAGAPLEQLYLDLLAPAARRIGDLWDRDLVSFMDVTIALGRLQRTIHALQAGAPRSKEHPVACRRILIAAMPGEQHTFGLTMLADLFARGGWHVETELNPGPRDVVRACQEQHFELIAISASCDAHVERLPALILALRRSSRNRRLMIMVGGRPFSEAPDLAMRVGADATAGDAAAAVSTAGKLLDLAARVD